MHNVFTLPHLFSLMDKIRSWNYLKNLRSLLNHPGWHLLCIQAERSEHVWSGEILVWRPLYKLVYFVCECVKGGVHCDVQIFELLKLAHLTKGFAVFWSVGCTVHKWHVKPFSLEPCYRVQGQMCVFHFVRSRLRTLVPPASFLLCDVNPVTCSIATPAHFISLQCWWPFWPHIASYSS